MFRKKLIMLKKTSSFVSVYTNHTEKSKFSFGQIINFDENYFAIKSFAPNGNPDGILIKDIENIFRIELDSQYSKK